MRCVYVDASGVVMDLVPQPADLGTCTLVLANPSELAGAALTLDAIGITSGSITTAFFWGFSAVVLGWAVSFPLRAALKAINLI